MRFSGFIVPIVICSIGFAFGLGSPDKFFSDVVPMGGVSLLLALAMIFFLLWDVAAQKQDNRERTNMYRAISTGFVLGMQIYFFKSLCSSIVFQIICFSIAAIAFAFAVIKYPNQRIENTEPTTE